MIIEKTVRLNIGQTIIYDPDLFYTTVLKVKREGLGYDIKYSGAVGNREVQHDSSSGAVIFLVPGQNPDPTNDVGLEKVYFLIKQP